MAKNTNPIEFVWILEQDNESNKLCVDNWGPIAEYLDLSGLMNLADVCADARTAARLVFDRKYGSNTFVTSEESDKNRHPLHVYGRNSIWIDKCKKMLQILRNFGYLIPEVIVDPDNTLTHRQLQIVIEYINKFCTQSRNTLVLRDYLPSLVENPLKNVNKVAMYTDEYSIDEFNALFPDIRTLVIQTKAAAIYMKHKVPNVKELYINAEMYELINEKRDNVLLAMRTNPQIEKLVIGCNEYVHFKMMRDGKEIELIIKNFIARRIWKNVSRRIFSLHINEEVYKFEMLDNKF